MKITKEILRNLIVESIQEFEDPYLSGEKESGEKEAFHQMYDEQKALVAELHSVIKAVEEGKNPRDILAMLEGTINSLRAAVGE